MKVPQYLYSTNEELQRFLALLVQQMQGALSDNGWTMPMLSTANVGVITNGTISPYFTPVMPVGTFWYNTSINQVQVIVQAAVQGTSNAIVETLGAVSGLPWQVITMDTGLLVGNGYFTSSGGTLNLALPTIASRGDVFRIANLGGNFKITQGLGQSVNFGDDTTTPSTGSITSLKVGDSLEIVCYQANTGFQVLSSMGNFIVA